MGIKPITMETLIKINKRKIKPKELHANLSKLDCAAKHILKIRQIIIA